MNISILTREYRPGSFVQRLVGKYWEFYKAFMVEIAKWLTNIHHIKLPFSGQYAEDLWIRFFIGVPDTYIDVGANHPEKFNNTIEFYKLGSRGVNVEPGSAMYAELSKQRPRDTNLHAGVGATNGKATLYKFKSHEICSFVESNVLRNGLVHGYEGTEEVDIFTLADLMGKYGVPDLLSVDVEGMDDAVLGGNDWSRFRPKLVVVEGRHDDFMKKVGYKHLLFNGLNSFYKPK